MGGQDRHRDELLALGGHQVDVGHRAGRTGHLLEHDAGDRLGLAPTQAQPGVDGGARLGLLTGEETHHGLCVALVEHGTGQGAGAAGCVGDDGQVAAGNDAQLHGDTVGRNVFVVRLHRREERAGGKGGSGRRGAGHGEGPVESRHGAQRSGMPRPRSGREGVAMDTSR